MTFWIPQSSCFPLSSQLNLDGERNYASDKNRGRDSLEVLSSPPCTSCQAWQNASLLLPAVVMAVVVRTCSVTALPFLLLFPAPCNSLLKMWWVWSRTWTVPPVPGCPASSRDCWPPLSIPHRHPPCCISRHHRMSLGQELSATLTGPPDKQSLYRSSILSFLPGRVS